MKYCKKCGTQLKDDAKFCMKCGQPAGGQGAGPAMGQSGQNKNMSQHTKSKKLWFGIGAGILAVILILVFVFTPTLRMKGNEKPIYNMVKFMETGNAKYIIKAIPLKQMVKAAKDELNLDVGTMGRGLNLDNYKDAEKSLEAIASLYQVGAKKTFGDNFKVKYEIESSKKIKDLEDLQSNYEEAGIKVKDAYKTKVKFTFKGDDESEKQTQSLNIIKIGNTWYLDILSLF